MHAPGYYNYNQAVAQSDFERSRQLPQPNGSGSADYITRVRPQVSQGSVSGNVARKRVTGYTRECIMAPPCLRGGVIHDSTCPDPTSGGAAAG